MTDADLFRALFRPSSVAIVGASGDRAKPSARVQRNLTKHGFTGALYPVNPTRDEIFGLKAYPSVGALPGRVDHAYVVTGSREVPQVVRDCAAAGIPVVSIFADGFADVGAEGRARQDALVREARASGVRLLGPNSMGVVNTVDHVALTVNAAVEAVDLAAGKLALVSQSGAMLGSLLSRAQARGLGFSRIASVGNEADLSVGEIVGLLADDRDTSAILLFLETLRDADRLAEAARRAYAAGKPVLAYKLGRSEAGRGLAAAHSGALAGPRENVSAYFRRHGILEIDHLDGLLEAAPLAMTPRRGRGRKVAVLTNTGGGAAVVADRLGLAGLELVPATDALIARVAQHKIRVGHGPVIDVTAAGTSKEVFQAALEEIVATDCDAVIVIVGSSGLNNPAYVMEPIVSVAGKGKAIATFVLPEAPQTMRMLAERNIPAFRTPEACADAVAAYLNWGAPRPLATVERATLAAAAAALQGAQGVLDEARSRRVFDALGAPQARAAVVRNGAEARALNLGFPVVAKIASPDLPHKTEVGGVALNIADANALAVAVDDMLAHIARTQPKARLEGVLVQEMHKGLGEAIVGYKRDPEVGPIVMVGVGGVLTEIYHDAAIRLAPVGRDEALEMIAEVRGLAPLRGYRNAPRGDLSALADTIAAVSRLALLDAPVREAEINPVIVKAEGVVAVDGLIVLSD